MILFLLSTKEASRSRYRLFYFIYSYLASASSQFARGADFVIHCFHPLCSGLCVCACGALSLLITRVI